MGAFQRSHHILHDNMTFLCYDVKVPANTDSYDYISSYKSRNPGSLLLRFYSACGIDSSLGKNVDSAVGNDSSLGKNVDSAVGINSALGKRPGGYFGIRTVDVGIYP